MTINEVSSASTASAFNVKLQKSQGDQHEAVVTRLIDSASTSSPSASHSAEVGKLLDVTA